MLKKEVEIKIKIEKVLGESPPFKQGGSWRLVIPRRVVKEYKIDELLSNKEYFGFIFLKTDKGILLVPISKVATIQTLREALKFIDFSHITNEDLQDILSDE